MYYEYTTYSIYIYRHRYVHELRHIAYPEATALRVAGQRLELTAPLIAVIDTGTTGQGFGGASYLIFNV